MRPQEKRVCRQGNINRIRRPPNMDRRQLCVFFSVANKRDSIKTVILFRRIKVLMAQIRKRAASRTVSAAITGTLAASHNCTHLRRCLHRRRHLPANFLLARTSPSWPSFNILVASRRRRRLGCRDKLASGHLPPPPPSLSTSQPSLNEL